MLLKFKPVKVVKLLPGFHTYLAEKIDLYFRQEGQIGLVEYPIYGTLNNEWCVRHSDGTHAVYHTNELEVQ